MIRKQGTTNRSLAALGSKMSEVIRVPSFIALNNISLQEERYPPGMADLQGRRKGALLSKYGKKRIQQTKQIVATYNLL
ncbi:hypothetical protein [Pedobacter endophyticus]|uniref:Uncharacterized protein n=1 Tax=Pedobacter endophyticus TaxID=2789740 RepID=A0A7S9KY43_9SPHI|nr:hypothetical protein [Pedobacter endophyticus]QPH38957.1 hypothetical protein IZT61_18115 [Pedobacter endophyticus]